MNKKHEIFGKRPAIPGSTASSSFKSWKPVISKLWLILFLLPLFIWSGCAKKSSVLGSGEFNKDFILPEENFTYMSIRTKIQFENGQQAMSGNATVRLKKDSAIWVSVNALLGVEAGRMLITQDGVSFINRLERTYFEADYPSLSRRFNFEMSYALFQEALLGNLPFELGNGDKVNLKKNSWEVKQRSNNLEVESLMDATIMKLTELQAAQRGTSNRLEMQLRDYQNLQAVNVPFKSMLSLSYSDGRKKDKTTLNLNHSRAQLESALAFPFSIPDRYTPIRL